MSRTRLILPLFFVLFAASSTLADEARYRVTGLFQPDRADDLRRQAGTLIVGNNDDPTEVKLVDVDYNAAVVTFAYDADSRHFKNQNTDQVRERINNVLRGVSRGSFSLSARSELAPDRLEKQRIEVAGLDCKGCAYGAYRVIANIEGVERAVVSFKEGHVTAWIDAAKTDRDTLVAALKKAQVDVREPDSSPTAKD